MATARYSKEGNTVEVSTNHVAMVSHPDEVLQLINTAAEAEGSA
jgi:hypothetical protein